MAGVKGKTKKKPPVKAPKSSRRARPAAKPAPAPAARARSLPPPPAPAPSPAPMPSHQPRLTPRPLMRGDFVLEKLHQIALTATNLDLAVEFYRDILGLKLIARFDPPGLAFFQLMGGARLLLSATASQATLYFLVDDINGAVNDLKKRGVAFLHPPAMIHRDATGTFGKKGNEEWMAFFKDPSGNTIGLVERR
jgi:catechol 2,3-dioxygenase-like lactoylglutathione lyase family enzyme